MIDAAGVGIGPFNLSVAALLQPLGMLHVRFFERKEQFQWHPGLLFPEATIQVSYLKDLVTLVDPTNPYSFLAFLAAHKRLYRFINARFSAVTRQEFNQYFQWVCSQLPCLEFNSSVEAISYHGDMLMLDLPNERVTTRNVILGTGLTPRIPTCAQPHLGDTVFHASQYLHHALQSSGHRIAVIGGGQTGAELVMQLLNERAALPDQVFWISRRPNFLPLDDSPFINELFTPCYSNYFFGLAPAQRQRLLEEQKLASDGISLDILERIYRRLYELELLEDRGQLCTLLPYSELVNLSATPFGWRLNIYNDLLGEHETLDVDSVILCTGFEYKIPDCLEPLMPRLHWDKQGFQVNADFSICWDGPPSCKIFVQNAARHARGIADPNLSLMAWRSAVIINTLVGRPVYDVTEVSSVFQWFKAEKHLD